MKKTTLSFAAFLIAAGTAYVLAQGFSGVPGANLFFAGPSSGPAAPASFRSLVTADFPASVVTGAKIATNTVANSNLSQAGANTMKGNWTAGTANEADNTMPSCADTAGNHLNYVNGTGITCGTSTGFSAAGQLTNSLGGDVNLNNTATYFDGPSIAQGSTGTWWVSGTVTINDTAGANIDCKLWDGTTVIAATRANPTAATAGNVSALSGFLASPAGNLRISCKDATTVNGKILFNATGNSKDSTISAFRIQ